MWKLVSFQWGGVLLFIVPLRELMLHKCIYMQQNQTVSGSDTE